jgi:hypothetical protein
MIDKRLLNKNVANIQNAAGSGSSPAERICDCSYESLDCKIIKKNSSGD